ncbi:MAG: hypothetical protein EAZ60_25225 [Oscillatoriales cyanobacterium]|nr:MAG: hypothetical protein EAZ94_20155 [Oscillatoriales cyanobacterium]TAE21555.1 MAG: hypothetical protein EAZ93_20195 [Oscillatoriales cyanobacterium]TAE39698.1 MAG: hypothetical protein EAZ90_22325 [Oscillatoriales cyanobacterium]TAE67272.1 MAG: hypothetical protein EAZ86_17665 [Oscillatoriales cyanobacterium]TAE95909.1 MAG: hypothetical protein EAZ79_16815 [Oscillatoriales cyanobacterium]
MQANISVGAKHDRSQYEMITNNLYAVMLRPLQKPDAPSPQNKSGLAFRTTNRFCYANLPDMISVLISSKKVEETV